MNFVKLVMKKKLKLREILSISIYTNVIRNFSKTNVFSCDLIYYLVKDFEPKRTKLTKWILPREGDMSGTPSGLRSYFVVVRCSTKEWPHQKTDKGPTSFRIALDQTYVICTVGGHLKSFLRLCFLSLTFNTTSGRLASSHTKVVTNCS